MHSFSQDYLEAIAKSACECSDSIPKGGTLEVLQMRFGLCIIDVSTPYKMELLRDHDIDLSKISFFAKSVIVAIAALLSRNPLALSSS